MERTAYETGTLIENGHAVGRDPRIMKVEQFNAMGFVDMPVLKVIRAKCIDCAGNNEAEVRKCTCVSCPLWPYRMGKNPFRVREISEEQREAIRERFRKRNDAPGEAKD